jgi:hypothetical protein
MFDKINSGRWLTAETLERLPPSLIFHARPKLATSLSEGRFKFLSSLAAYARDQGLEVHLTHFSREVQRLAMEDLAHYHIFMDDMPGYALNTMFCVPSYFRGFWFFDEIGTRNNSTQRIEPFDPRLIAPEEAASFFGRLRRRLIETNRSRLPQPPKGQVLEKGALCLFVQGFTDQPYHRHYMSAPEFIEAAIAAKGARKLYIKAHPTQKADELAIVQSYHNPDAGVEVIDASIHDMLPIAHCVLTLTSAVGIEAFLHEKPVVLGGQTDFWQNAITLTEPEKLSAAIDAAVSRDWPHKAFLTWFFRDKLLEDSDKSLPEALEKLHRKGWLWADQGRGYF